MKQNLRALALLLAPSTWELFAPHGGVTRFLLTVAFGALWMAAFIWTANRWERV